MHYSLIGKKRLPVIDSDLLEVPFKAGLNVFGFLLY
jgi:hypothetical protein